METKWIPVSEKLPGDGQVVIGQDKSGFIKMYKYYADYHRCWLDEHDEFFLIDEIVAWMPMPEPYKGERECMNKN